MHLGAFVDKNVNEIQSVSLSNQAVSAVVNF